MPTILYRAGTAWILLLVFAWSAVAETETNQKKTSTPINGVLTFRENFQIFPVGKQGNTIYFNETKILSKPDLTMHDAIGLFDGYVYYGTNGKNEPVLGFEGDPQISFNALEGGYCTLATPKRQKKIVRIGPKKRIQILLPNSNTAAGLVYNGFEKAAFFHIYKGETVETEEGNFRYQYTFKIHIVRSREDETVTLRNTVTGFSPNLKLKWIDRHRLQYQLSNGRVNSISIR